MNRTNYRQSEHEASNLPNDFDNHIRRYRDTEQLDCIPSLPAQLPAMPLYVCVYIASRLIDQTKSYTS